MSALAGLVGVWCVQCGRAGHKCQAQMWQDEPVCLRCADGEPCCYETAAGITERFGMDEPVDPCVVPIPDRPIARGKHGVTVTPPRFENNERSQIRRELAHYDLEAVARRHSVEPCMLAEMMSAEEPPSRRKLTSNERQLVARRVRKPVDQMIDGETVKMAPGASMGSEMIGLRERPVTIDAVKSAVAEQFGISVMEMDFRRHATRFVRPRQVAMFLAFATTVHGCMEIGHAFQQHHATVIYSVKLIEKKRLQDATLNKYVENARAALCADLTTV